MKKQLSAVALALLAAAGAPCNAGPAVAPVAGGAATVPGGKPVMPVATKHSIEATADPRAKIDIDLIALRAAVTTAQTKPADPKHLDAARRKDFGAASARMRKSADKVLG